MNWIIREDSREEWEVLAKVFGFSEPNAELISLIAKNQFTVTDALVEEIKRYASSNEGMLNSIYSSKDYFREDPRRLLSLIKAEREYWPELLKRVAMKCHSGLIYKGSSSELFLNILTLPLNIKVTSRDEHFFVSGIFKLSEWVALEEESYASLIWTRVKEGKPEKNLSVTIKIILCLGGKKDKSVRLPPQYLKTIHLLYQSLYSDEKKIPASAKSVVKGALNLLKIPDNKLGELWNIYKDQEIWC